MVDIGASQISVERMMRAVELVRERLLRATAVLERAGLPYAVVGGHAVAAWVSRVDPILARYTRNVDIVIRRSDFDRVTAAFESAGFIPRHSAGIQMFLDGAETKARDAVRVLFAGEKVRSDDLYPIADVEPFEQSEGYRFVALESIVRTKLTSFRLKDQVHLQDLIKAGLVDESWLTRLPEDLAVRLKPLIEDPNA